MGRKRLVKKKLNRSKDNENTVEEMILKASDCLNQLHFESAIELYKKALLKDATNTNIMDALADVYIQVGETDQALILLEESTRVSPSENPFKWLFLAQLQTGLESAESYQTAIKMLNINLKDQIQDEVDAETYKKQIAKAYCSIAELYMTDLCFEENAEEMCENSITTAFEYYPDSLDGQQTLASLRISQNRKKEAETIIQRVYERLHQIKEVIKSRTIIDEIKGVEESPELEDNPESEFCIATCKLLIECSTEQPALSQFAMDLLNHLLEEDDENVELWYLMGVAAISCQPPDVQQAKYFLQTAYDMLIKLKEDEASQEQSSIKEEFSFQSQLDLVIEHLEILNKIEPTSIDGTENLIKNEVPSNLLQTIFEKMKNPQGKLTIDSNMNDKTLPIDEEWSDVVEEEEGEVDGGDAMEVTSQMISESNDK